MSYDPEYESWAARVAEIPERETVFRLLQTLETACTMARNAHRFEAQLDAIPGKAGRLREILEVILTGYLCDDVTARVAVADGSDVVTIQFSRPCDCGEPHR